MPRRRVALQQFIPGSFKADVSAVDARTRSQIDDMVGDADHLGMVLHQQHRIAGVAQPAYRALEPFDVARMQADARLVEDVEHVGERGVDVLGNLAALRFAAGERADRPVERQVAEADLFQRRQARADGGLQVGRQRVGEPGDPGVEPGDRQGADLRDVQALDAAGQHFGIEARAAAVGAGAHRQHRIQHGGVQQPFLGVDDAAVHTRDQAFVLSGLGPVRRRVFEADLRAVEEEVQFFGRIVLDFLVEVEQAAVRVADPAPAALAEGDVVDGVLVVEALVEIHEFVDVELPDLAQAGAARTAALRMVEAETVGIAHERLAYARKEQAQQRVDIRVCADGRAGILRRLLLVDDDGDGKALDGVDLRASVFREILLHEGGEGVIELPTALRRDGIHHQGALARAGYAGENGDLVFRYVERDIAQVVLPRPADPDGVETVHRQRP